MAHLKTIAVALVALSLAACAAKPSDTVKAMNADLCKTGDLSSIGNHVSESSKPALSAIAMMMSEPNKAAAIKADIQKNCADGKASIEIVKETVNGDRAVVEYKEGGQLKTMNLVKEKDGWKAELNNSK